MAPGAINKALAVIWLISLLLVGCQVATEVRATVSAGLATAETAIALSRTPPSTRHPSRTPSATPRNTATSSPVGNTTTSQTAPTLALPATLTPRPTTTSPAPLPSPTLRATNPSQTPPIPSSGIATIPTPPSSQPTTPPALPTSTPAGSEPTAVSVTSLPPAPVGVSGPNVYETTISIPTYGYEAGFLPSQLSDPFYPYPSLDFSQVGPPVVRTYQAIVLENGYVSLTILPELGGRIYRWVDKATGRHLLYENPVIKPTSWGYRGWWLAAGGIEWAFPVEEHGLNEWRPWSYTIGSSAYGTAVTVSNVEDRTGMEVGATISLNANHAYVTLQPWVRNNTGQAHPYQLWLNAMIALNGNHVSPQTQLIVPANEVVIHSASDGGVPSSGTISWPYYGGRDLSHYGNWTGHLSFFVPNVWAGFTGVYDYATDQGIVRAYNPGWPAGTKFFGPGGLSPELWTDDTSNYLELWSGATASFWSSANLEAGQSFSWTEHWYPVHGLGGFHYANRTAVLRLSETATGADLGVAVSTRVEGRVTLWAGGQQVAEWPLTIVAGQAFRVSWQRPAGIEGPLGLRFAQNDGTIIAQTGQLP
jgi:hypothetical protein